jgi:hypothetical protein
MTICPIAIAVGCAKCPAFSVCPLKSVLGDQKPGATQDDGDSAGAGGGAGTKSGGASADRKKPR